MEWIRKSILFLAVAGIMLQIGRFSELVVDEARSPPREGPALVFFFAVAAVVVDALRLTGEGFS